MRQRNHDSCKIIQQKQFRNDLILKSKPIDQERKEEENNWDHWGDNLITSNGLYINTCM